MSLELRAADRKRCETNVFFMELADRENMTGTPVLSINSFSSALKDLKLYVLVLRVDPNFPSFVFILA